MRQNVIAIVFLLFILVSFANAKLIVSVTILAGGGSDPSSNSVVTNLVNSFAAGTFTTLGNTTVLNVTKGNSTGTTPTTSTTSSTPTTPTSGSPSSSTPTTPTSSTPSSSSAATSVSNVLVLIGALALSFGLSGAEASRKTFLGLFFLYLISSGYALTGTYTSCKLLSDAIDYRLYWRLDSANGEIYVAQEATLSTGLGWLAVGISPNGKMNGGGTPNFSDIVHGYAGSTNMSDLNTNIYSKPVPDVQDVVMLNNAQVGNRVTLEWKRKLVTNDPLDHPITPDTQQLIIWSANDGNAPTDANTFAIHTIKEENGGVPIVWSSTYTCPGQAGDVNMVIELDMRQIDFDASRFIANLASVLGVAQQRVVINSVVEEEPPFCPECEIIELRFPNYTVPSQVTTYVYRGFQLPPGPPKQIIRFEPILDNTLVLHHIVLYLDAKGNSTTNAYVFNQPTGSLPIFAWAPGSDRFDMPPDVGYLVRNSTSDSYLIVNVHYNNPSNLAGLVDSSGFRIYLNTTRQHNAGFIWLGTGVLFPSNSTSSPALAFDTLPAGYSSLHYMSVCPDTATFAALSTQKTITVFAYFMHMHLLGRQIWTDWVRTVDLQGTKQYMGKLGVELDYRFDSQKFVPVANPWVLKGGDGLVTHCVYDTTGVTGPTYGGEATNNEMCLQGIMYYPNYGFSGCSATSNGFGNCTTPCPEALSTYYTGPVPPFPN